ARDPNATRDLGGKAVGLRAAGRLPGGEEVAVGVEFRHEGVVASAIRRQRKGAGAGVEVDRAQKRAGRVDVAGAVHADGSGNIKRAAAEMVGPGERARGGVQLGNETVAVGRGEGRGADIDVVADHSAADVDGPGGGVGGPTVDGEIPAQI